MSVQLWMIVLYAAATAAVGFAASHRVGGAKSFHGAALSIPAVVLIEQGR